MTFPDNKLKKFVKIIFYLPFVVVICLFFFINYTELITSSISANNEYYFIYDAIFNTVLLITIIVYLNSIKFRLIAIFVHQKKIIGWFINLSLILCSFACFKFIYYAVKNSYFLYKLHRVNIVAIETEERFDLKDSIDRKAVTFSNYEISNNRIVIHPKILPKFIGNFIFLYDDNNKLACLPILYNFVTIYENELLLSYPSEFKPKISKEVAEFIESLEAAKAKSNNKLISSSPLQNH